ncbi:hypothetical protein AVDCRST_MAG92-757 [uncultured Coleofasciculus sp.]|uniref:Uncharacterized protein n=1 Tax=uncultured Coleofasciculus sp. TaxID=1267456 RepID=A0A6J4HI26_9CYAN|nr:hypothetical protein AVDCRST_MAG92-757 [uncultured Coleofasciculus sp.]
MKNCLYSKLPNAGLSHSPTFPKIGFFQFRKTLQKIYRLSPLFIRTL